jgi:hypothetical protein
LTRALILLALLAGCSGPAPVIVPDCPGPVPVPAPLHAHENVGKLEIRVELAREAEKKRGDACASSVDAMRVWIKELKK